MKLTRIIIKATVIAERRPTEDIFGKECLSLTLPGIAYMIIRSGPTFCLGYEDAYISFRQCAPSFLHRGDCLLCPAVGTGALPLPLALDKRQVRRFSSPSSHTPTLGAWERTEGEHGALNAWG